MAKKAHGTRVRDAKTGQFLPKGTDKRRPNRFDDHVPR